VQLVDGKIASDTGAQWPGGLGLLPASQHNRPAGQ
jgi:isocitrate/isopropylmalate dehydrogenase